MWEAYRDGPFFFFADICTTECVIGDFVLFASSPVSHSFVSIVRAKTMATAGKAQCGTSVPAPTCVCFSALCALWGSAAMEFTFLHLWSGCSSSGGMKGWNENTQFGQISVLFHRSGARIYLQFPRVYVCGGGSQGKVSIPSFSKGRSLASMQFTLYLHSFIEITDYLWLKYSSNQPWGSWMRCWISAQIV